MTAQRDEPVSLEHAGYRWVRKGLIMVPELLPEPPPPPPPTPDEVRLQHDARYREGDRSPEVMTTMRAYWAERARKRRRGLPGRSVECLVCMARVGESCYESHGPVRSHPSRLAEERARGM